MSGTIDNTSFDGDDSPQTKILLEKQFERTNKIYKGLKYLVEPGAVTELRDFEVAVSETYTAKTISGYYDIRTTFPENHINQSTYLISRQTQRPTTKDERLNLWCCCNTN